MTGRCARLTAAGILMIALALPALGAAKPAPQPQRVESESRPYAMLLAALGLIGFIARRRTRALNAGG